MKSFPLLAVLALLLVAAPLLNPLLAEEAEEEGVAVIIARSNMSPALKEPVVDLFNHIHLLETSFRNGRWENASYEVDQVDHFYTRILKLSETMQVNVELRSLQAFEFSLAELTRGIKRRDRELVERRFLQLQPELFDILDRFAAVPLRLTASRFYIDLAINGLEEKRFDIALDELGEIDEYMEQLEQTLTAKGVDLVVLNQQLEHAREILLRHGEDSKQALEEIRKSLERLFQIFATQE